MFFASFRFLNLFEFLQSFNFLCKKSNEKLIYTLFIALCY